MDDVTAEDIAKLREEAEREREGAKAKDAQKKRRKKSKKKQIDRVTVDALENGGVITIVPSKPLRDREIALGLLSVPIVVAMVWGGLAGGALGFAIAVSGSVAVIALLLMTASAIHIRWTAAGDCILYKRDPRRPIWAGRCGDFAIDTSITMRKNKSISYLRFAGRMLHYYPLTSSDTTVLRDTARIAGMQNKDTRWPNSIG